MLVNGLGQYDVRNTNGARIAEIYADWTVATPTVGKGVTEPGSLALLGLGMAALGWPQRRHVGAKPAL